MDERAPHGALPPAVMRIGALSEIPPVLRSFGADAERVLAEVGLSPEAMAPDRLIDLDVLGALLQLCSERTACGHFGLLVGNQARPEHYGLVGELMRHSPTLGAAIIAWASNQHRFVRGSAIHLLNRGDTLIMTYRVHQANITGLPQIIDAAVAAGNAVLRNLSAAVPSEVWLPRLPPMEPQAYRGVFGIKPRYDVSVGGLAYSRYTLDQPIPGADPDRHRLLDAEVRRYRAVDVPNFADQVRRQLGARIATDMISKAEIARALGVHEREMSRRLNESGTTFRNLTNAARFEAACQLLANTDLPIRRIAEALQYGDASSFVKAFRRTGRLPPLAWRQRSRSAGPASHAMPGA